MNNKKKQSHLTKNKDEIHVDKTLVKLVQGSLAIFTVFPGVVALMSLFVTLSRIKTLVRCLHFSLGTSKCQLREH